MDRSLSKTLRLILVGDGLNMLGGWLDFIAILTIPAFTLNAGPIAIAILSAVLLLPAVLLRKPIQRLCDSEANVLWLRLSLLFRAISTLLLVLCGSILSFLAVALVRSLFHSFTQPAVESVSAFCVPSASRQRYYSALNLINSSAKILCPALGAVIGSIYSYQYVLVISGTITIVAAGIFQWSAVGIASCYASRHDRLKNSELGAEPYVEDVDSPVWQYFCLISMGYYFSVFMVNNQLPIILKQEHLPPESLGVLISAAAAGNLAYGIASAKRWSPTLLRGRLWELITPNLATMLVFFLIALGFIVMRGNIWLLGCLFFMSGLATARFFIAARFYTATNFSSALGKATSSVQSIQNLSMLLAPIFGGVVLTFFEPWMLFFLSAGVGVIYPLMWIRKMSGLSEARFDSGANSEQ